jgi:predicted nucleotidyltransferase
VNVREAARARILNVASDLPATVLERIVFTGGSILPLLANIEARLKQPRPTKDVDAVMATTGYPDLARAEEALRNAGFTATANHLMTSGLGPPICRWKTPSGETFDLTATGEHAGGTGSLLDQLAIETALPMSDAEHVRHASSTGFLLTKARAYLERGARTENRDLHDIAVLVACQPELLTEIAHRPEAIRQTIRAEVTLLLKSPNLSERVRRAFKDRAPMPPDTPSSLEREVLALLRRIEE